MSGIIDQIIGPCRGPEDQDFNMGPVKPGGFRGVHMSLFPQAPINEIVVDKPRTL